MNRKIVFSNNEYYHVFNRGTEKRDIFLNENDYKRFLVLLYLCNSEKPVDLREHFREGRTFAELFLKNENNEDEKLIDIGAYCLISNHFHLLIKQRKENGITIFMKKLNTAYAMYFNIKNKRNGNLFQGKFGAQHLDSDEYLKYIFAYIHLNPIKLIEQNWKEEGIKNTEEAKEFLNKYKWSSYLNYVNKDQNNPILNTKEFPGYFENKKEFSEFIEDWLNYEVE